MFGLFKNKVEAEEFGEAMVSIAYHSGSPALDSLAHLVEKPGDMEQSLKLLIGLGMRPHNPELLVAIYLISVCELSIDSIRCSHSNRLRKGYLSVLPVIEGANVENELLQTEVLELINKNVLYKEMDKYFPEGEPTSESGVLFQLTKYAINRSFKDAPKIKAIFNSRPNLATACAIDYQHALQFNIQQIYSASETVKII